MLLARIIIVMACAVVALPSLLWMAVWIVTQWRIARMAHDMLQRDRTAARDDLTL